MGATAVAPAPALLYSDSCSYFLPLANHVIISLFLFFSLSTSLSFFSIFLFFFFFTDVLLQCDAHRLQLYDFLKTSIFCKNLDFWFFRSKFSFYVNKCVKILIFGF